MRDLFGYRRAFSEVLDRQPPPYGLGYAWGEGLQPSLDSDVTLCTPDTLTDALALVAPAPISPADPETGMKGGESIESRANLTWRKVRPPDGYRDAYEAAYNAVNFRAILSASAETWRLECTCGDLAYEFGGISHEATFRACRDRIDDEIAQGKWEAGRPSPDAR